MDYLEQGLEVLKIFNTNGFKAYFVGGFVRDYLHKSPINDIDIATDATPSQIESMFETSLKGIKYNSVVIKYKGFEFETTTFRCELGTSDNRHPIYENTKELALDLKRRDFTINAMAMDNELNIVDLFGGKSDLENGVIKTVGNPKNRFTEDALRMLRACYFSAKLNFKIDKETLRAMKECSYLVQKLSHDRILWELEKLCNSTYPLVGISYLVESGIYKYLEELKDGVLLISKKKIRVSDYKEFLEICFYDKTNDIMNWALKSDLRTDILEVIRLSKDNIKNNYSNSTIFENGIERVVRANHLNIKLYNSKDNEDVLREAYKNFPIYKLTDMNYKIIDVADDFNIKDMQKAKEMIIDARNAILDGVIPNNPFAIKKYLMSKYE